MRVSPQYNCFSVASKIAATRLATSIALKSSNFASLRVPSWW